MGRKWFVTRGGEDRQGPLSSDELQSLAASGKLAPTDLVWKEGMGKWMPAKKVKGLFTTVHPTPAPHPPMAQVVPPVAMPVQQTPNPGTPQPVIFSQIQSPWRSLRYWISFTPLRTLFTGIAIGALLVLSCFLPVRTSSPNDSKGVTPKRAQSTSDADDEFRIAASHKGDRAFVAAKMLIEFRRNDNWSWDRLEGEVKFQFSEIKDNFDRWKRDRIAAGDRYK